MRITYLVYSGRPNPSVLLDEADARRVVAPLYEGKRTAEHSDAPHPILGYNRILVENHSVPGLSPWLHVSSGRVDVRDGTLSVRSDLERKLERALIDLGTAKGALQPEVSKMIGP